MADWRPVQEPEKWYSTRVYNPLGRFSDGMGSEDIGYDGLLDGVEEDFMAQETVGLYVRYNEGALEADLGIRNGTTVTVRVDTVYLLESNGEEREVLKAEDFDETLGSERELNLRSASFLPEKRDRTLRATVW